MNISIQQTSSGLLFSQLFCDRASPEFVMKLARNADLRRMPGKILLTYCKYMIGAKKNKRDRNRRRECRIIEQSGLKNGTTTE
jgi:hypothetical protein